MSLVRITLAFFVGIAMPVSAMAQNVDSSGIIMTSGQSGSVRIIQNVIDSMGLEDPHAREATRLQDELLKSARPKTLIHAAKETGLHGKWRVVSGKKDGLFSPAQIGQQPGDVITLVAADDAPGLLSMG